MQGIAEARDAVAWVLLSGQRLDMTFIHLVHVGSDRHVPELAFLNGAKAGEGANVRTSSVVASKSTGKCTQKHVNLEDPWASIGLPSSDMNLQPFKTPSAS